MDKHLILNDGTKIVNGFASRSSADQLMVRIPGNDFVAASTIFTDSSKTQKIEYYFGAYKYTFEGYTDLFSIQYYSESNYIELWLNPHDRNATYYNREILISPIYMPEEEETDNGNGS